MEVMKSSSCLSPASVRICLGEPFIVPCALWHNFLAPHQRPKQLSLQIWTEIFKTDAKLTFSLQVNHLRYFVYEAV